MPEPEEPLQAYLKGDSEISRRYRECREDLAPPAALDQRIRTAAREATAPPAVAFTPFSRNWHVPAALAAVLILSIGVTLLLARQEGLPVVPETEPGAASSEPGPPVPRLQTEPHRQRAAQAPLMRGADGPHSKLDGTSTRPLEPEEPRADSSEAGDAAAPPPITRPLSAETQEAAPGVVASPPEGSRLDKTAGQDGAPAPQRSATPPTNRQRDQPPLPADPETWLQDIRRLFETGDVQAAERSLRAFRRVHPAFPQGRMAAILGEYWQPDP